MALRCPKHIAWTIYTPAECKGTDWKKDQTKEPTQNQETKPSEKKVKWTDQKKEDKKDDKRGKLKAKLVELLFDSDDDE